MSSPNIVLYAMKEDSEKVPVLLTDYILKGKYCFLKKQQQKNVLIPYLSKVSDTKTFVIHLVQSSVLPKVPPDHETNVILRLPVHLPPPFGLPTELHDLQHGPSPSSSLYSPRLLTAAFC